ncbi:sensor histidine kinase [Litorimonas haliclonae]|uniref:sensor histidine kinase n=1 Tax=Litorimonas haliclonae TaxID=2081977 RepID=UPI0039EED406
MGIETKSQISDLSKKAGHDLKSPLRKIRQFAELMSLEYSDALNGEGEIYLNALTESAEEASDVVNSLLLYIRCLTETLSLTQVSLEDVIETVSTRIYASFGQSIFLDYNTLPTVNADQGMMTLLFMHLIENGCRFVAPDTSPKVSIESERTDSHIIIHVVDNGIGITGEGAEKVFEPLMRLHPKSGYKGSGLGLAICKVICDAHGWDIGFSNNPHGGTTFKLTLPVS